MLGIQGSPTSPRDHPHHPHPSSQNTGVRTLPVSARQSTVSHWHRRDPPCARTNKAEPEVLFFSFFRVQSSEPPFQPSRPPNSAISSTSDVALFSSNPAEYQLPDDTPQRPNTPWRTTGCRAPPTRRSPACGGCTGPSWRWSTTGYERPVPGFRAVALHLLFLRGRNGGG